MRRSTILLGLALSACAPTQPQANQTEATLPVGTANDDLAVEAGAAHAPAATATPSYDCANAATQVEKLICSDETLAAYDRAMAATWRKERAAAGGAASPALEAKQHDFLEARNACADADCIAEAYRKRAGGGFDRAVAAGGSCAAEIGMAEAQTLVRQCLDVSPATHPPCNVANSCAIVRDEIARSCDMFDLDDPTRPAFCDAAESFNR